MKKAFTLAEVLITLGIIGVVAALTLPSLITNYKVKVLKNQFKTADAIIHQALLNASNEVGMDLSDLKLEGTSAVGGQGQAYKDLKAQIPAINEAWKSQFKGATYLNGSEFYYHVIAHGQGCHDMMGDVGNCPFGGGYLLQNGMLVSSIAAAIDGGMLSFPGYIYFTFDTNGPFKGPNRLGYDIFYYRSIAGFEYSAGYNYSYTALCNPTSKDSYGQQGCYYWAHRDINPIDKSKSYWDILYKPLSYWQKSGK